jgi:hypothetical protein
VVWTNHKLRTIWRHKCASTSLGLSTRASCSKASKSMICSSGKVTEFSRQFITACLVGQSTRWARGTKSEARYGVSQFPKAGLQ